MKDDKEYFFTCMYTTLRGRIDTLAERAQKDKKFTHAFSPHCLRHEVEKLDVSRVVSYARKRGWYYLLENDLATV